MQKKGLPNSDKAQKVFAMTEGVISRLTDAILVSIYFGAEAFLSSRSSVWQAGDKAQKDLNEFNYDSIKNTLKQLKRKGLINIVVETGKLPGITEAGRKRLSAIIPFYDTKRVWDKKVYLITYDLPVDRNKDRNRLREYLKTIGCGMLQESVWLTCYNPKKLVEEFVAGLSLEDSLIIVSSIGKDGTIGEMDLKTLMGRVFGLSRLNERYVEFQFEMRNGQLSKEQIIFQYLSILKDDPQIPFELLPDDWVGDRVFREFDALLKGV